MVYHQETPRAWSGMALPVAEDRVLLSAEAAALVVALLERYRRVERVPFSPGTNALHAACVAVSSRAGHAQRASSGQGDVPKVDAGTSSSSWITCAEAARRLGISRRQASRLARDGRLGPSRLVGGARVVQPEEVAARAAEQKEAVR